MGLLSFLGLGSDVSKTVDSVGNLAKSIREAITGEAVVTEEGRIKLQQIAQQLDLAQASINQVEAANQNLFVSGWRPFIGWGCGIGFYYVVLIFPLLTWVSGIYRLPTPPQLDIGALVTIMTSMLGMGSLRTFEKVKGVTK